MLLLDSPAQIGRQPHLTTLRALERHRRSEARQAGYEDLLRDFGIAPERFAALVESPRLVFAEQPGCWFYGEDLIRARLLRHLLASGGFHPASGVVSLAQDGFSCRGIKRLFMTFALHAELGPVPLLGAAYIRRHRHRVYRALPLDGAAYERLAGILDIAIALLEAARCSPRAFAAGAREILARGLRSGVRPLLPAVLGRRALLELGARLGAYDLGAALEPLRTARRLLVPGLGWPAYWDGVNAAFFDLPVARLGPLFNRFLLTVEDPVRMARTLGRECGWRPERPIPVAAIVTAGAKYRMVWCLPERAAFFYEERPGERRSIRWDDVVRQAERGETGGPAGTLEYLLMAAAGLYLVADHRDGFNRFEAAAREIHERYTGWPFPYVAFDVRTAVRAHEYLDLYAPSFERASRVALDSFFS